MDSIKAEFMTYSVKVSGVVHSLDPIRSHTAYARAVFGDNLNQVRTSATGKQLMFEVIGSQQVSKMATLEEMTQGLFTSDDNNVTWDITFSQSM